MSVITIEPETAVEEVEQTEPEVETGLNENARKWVAALRSGEYKQTEGCLRNKKGYCCLGVATDLYIREHSDESWCEVSGVGDDPESYVTQESQQENYLPGVVQDWLDLDDTTGSYLISSDVSSLAADNDNGSSFEDIANTIEAQPTGLFRYQWNY